MKKKKGTLISAIPALKPTLITDAKTREIIDPVTFYSDLETLVTTVKEAAQEFYLSNKELVETELKTYKGLPQPAAYARQKGWNMARGLPREVKVKSRIENLARYNLVQTVSSYVLSPNPKKQPPNFSKTITLGAVDSAMVKLEWFENKLLLIFKCWSKEYELHFILPAYILERSIIKFSLPTIRMNKNNEWVFDFAIQEQAKVREVGKHTAGVDLGRVEPFTLAVLNESNKRVSHYVSSGRLNQLNQKRERLLSEKKHIATKIESYTGLGLDSTILSTERDFKRNKITRLGVEVAKQVGFEITQKLVKHKVSILNMEDLRWVTGAKYGSKWNHSKQQEHITHSLSRRGITTRKVNPKNTSQECYVCGTKLVHNTKNRTVRCVECKTKLDRDFNAAMNIAKNKNKNVPPSVITGGVGVTVVQKGQVTTTKLSDSMLRITRSSTCITSVTSLT